MTMASMFNFVGGIGVMPDPDDNPDNHDVPHHDSGAKIALRWSMSATAAARHASASSSTTCSSLKAIAVS
jgi:hypothetical protein